MRSHLAKVTSKNQLTIPAWAMEALGCPTHFRIAVVRGNLVMFSAGLATFDEQAKEAGIPPDVLREARALVERRKREQAATEQASAGGPPARGAHEATSRPSS